MEITKVGDAFKVVSAIRDAGNPRRRVRKDRHDSIHRGRHPRALRHRDPARCCIEARDGRALDTVPAFGSMWAADYPGMSSMGKMMALALVCTMAAAVLFQPGLGRPRQIKPFPNTRTHLPQAAEYLFGDRVSRERALVQVSRGRAGGLYEAPQVKGFFTGFSIGQLPFPKGVVRAVEQCKAYVCIHGMNALFAWPGLRPQVEIGQERELVTSLLLSSSIFQSGQSLPIVATLELHFIR
jgi:hypothetical protein